MGIAPVHVGNDAGQADDGCVIKLGLYGVVAESACAAKHPEENKNRFDGACGQTAAIHVLLPLDFKITAAVLALPGANDTTAW